MKLVEKELGAHHIAADIGCHLFSILPPFNVGATTMGYGLGPASASALNGGEGKRAVSFIGDGGFWHNGLNSSVGNAVYNKSDNVTVVVDNHYSAATGGQDLLSSRAVSRRRSTGHAIAQAARGVGAGWVRQIDRTYDVARMRATLREALTTAARGPKVIVASSECMLNRQRREKPLMQAAAKAGKRVVRPRFGVDQDVCTGDHACMRLSGCPSLSLKHTGEKLRDDPVAVVDNSCVGCGHCGEVANAAVLCPSFYRADIVENPSRVDRMLCAYPGRRDRRVATPPRRQALDAGLRWTARSPSRCWRSAAKAAACWWTGSLRWPSGRAGAHSRRRFREWRSAPGRRSTMSRRSRAPPGRTPVFSAMAAPGDVDVVIAAEWMEAGRAIQRGLVTPDRTTLIASTHRTLAVSEKEGLGDGMANSSAVTAAARVACRRFVAFDMATLAERAGSVVSSVLFGALCGTGVLPFGRASFEATISDAGVGVQASLRGFALGLKAVEKAPDPVAAPTVAVLAPVGHAPYDALQIRAAALPEAAHETLAEGLRLVVAYQDIAYGTVYLDAVEMIAGLGRRKAPPDPGSDRGRRQICCPRHGL